ncbi:MAG TPA: type II secretion system protein [Kofleriaceae bacterium]|nr:type II secretion system protein [Kofleriaceae bacterium]
MDRHVRAARGGADGFTLIEVMVVIAIIGLLAVSAVLFVKPRSYAASAQGYAQEVASLCDSVRQRAVASRTYQKLEVQGDEVIHWQGATSGMTPPTDWNLVGTTPVPSQIVIAATSDRTHASPDDSVPNAGIGLPAEIDFAPDGTATAATIFVTDSAEEIKARVAIYRATGSAYAYYGW